MSRYISDINVFDRRTTLINQMECNLANKIVIRQTNRVATGEGGKGRRGYFIEKKRQYVDKPLLSI